MSWPYTARLKMLLSHKKPLGDVRVCVAMALHDFVTTIAIRKMALESFYELRSL